MGNNMSMRAILLSVPMIWLVEIFRRLHVKQVRLLEQNLSDSEAK
jgi:hypothetical protein